VDQCADCAQWPIVGSNDLWHQAGGVSVFQPKMGSPSVRVSSGVLDSSYGRHDHRSHAKDARFKGREHSQVLVATRRGELCLCVQLSVREMAIRELARRLFTDVPASHVPESRFVGRR